MIKSHATVFASLFLAGIATAFSPASSAREIVLGQSIWLTGGGAEVGRQYQAGAQCYFDLANKAGGIRGNTIRLVSLDDGGKTEKTVQNVKTLLEREKVFALVESLVPVDTMDEAFVCGPGAKIEEAAGALRDCGVPATRIHVESFGVPGQAPAHRVEPGDAPHATIEIVIDGSRREVEFFENDPTILGCVN